MLSFRMQSTSTATPRWLQSFAAVLSLLVVSDMIPFTSAFNINTPVVICPGFGNDQIDYYKPLKQPREVGLVAGLERRGFNSDRIYTVPVQRSDWIRVAGGLLDWGFYTNKAVPTGKAYGWYLNRLKETVNQAYEESGGERVMVIGHSAGGWLARAAMGDGVWCDDGDTKNNDEDENSVVRTSQRIRCLVTVGAIHRPPPIETGVGCVTRGALAYTDESYPGAFLASEGVAYISVGGDAIVGDNTEKTRDELETKSDELYAVRGEGSASRVAYTSYEAVCGTGGTTGDGVVPLEWTQLEGAKQLQLDGVLHSINEAGTTIPTDRWYGSENVIDRWLPTVLQEAGIQSNNKKNNNNAQMLPGLKDLQKWTTQQVSAAQEKLFQSR